jgi:hypothetical protein
MSDFIKIDRTNSAAVFASKLVALPGELRRVMDKLEEIQQMGYHMFTAGSPPDFTVFETNFGIPTGQGNAVFDLVNGTLLALNGTAQNANALDLVNRVG